VRPLGFFGFKARLLSEHLRARHHERNMSDELANDRTFLAWLRTGIAVMGLGFVVAKVALIVQPTNKAASNQELYAAVGIVIVVCGGALVLIGYFQHKTVLDLLSTDDVKPRPRWPLTITATAVAGSLLLSVPIAVST
jgi:putative membrane protein